MQFDLAKAMPLGKNVMILIIWPFMGKTGYQITIYY